MNKNLDASSPISPMMRMMKNQENFLHRADSILTAKS